MRRFFLFFSALLGLLLVAGFSAFMILQPGYLAPALAEIVKARSGKTLSFSGAPRLSLWPTPVVTYLEVSIGDGAANVLAIGELRLAMTYAALFGKRAEFEAVTLAEPHLDLRVDADGTGNWATAADAGAALAFFIENGSIAFSDARNGQRFSADEIRASGSFGAEGSALSVKGGVVWNRQAASFDLFLKSANRFAAEGSPATFSIAAPTGNSGFEGRAAISKGFGLAGQFTLAAPDLRAFLRWINLPVTGARGLKDVRLAAAIDAGTKGATLRDALIEMDGMTATGALALSSGKTGPALEGGLIVERLNADAWLAPGRWPAWSAEPNDFTALKGMTVKLAIDAKTAGFRGHEATAVNLDLALENGRLDLAAKPFAAFGGMISGQLHLDGSRQVAAMSLAALATDVDSAVVDGRLKGKASGAMSVSSTGGTEEEMISRLTGTAKIAVSDGGFSGWGGAATAFSSLAASFTIADGIMTTPDARLETGSASIAASGDIDLLRRAVDISATAGGEAFVARGPWGGPAITTALPEGGKSAYGAAGKTGQPDAQ